MATNPTDNLVPQDYFSTTLSAGCTAADTTIYLTSLPTATEGFLVLDHGTSSAEVIFYNAKGANFVTVPSTADRGLGGTTAVAHSSGATVKQTITAEYYTALQNGYSNIGMHTTMDEAFSDFVVSSGVAISQSTGLIGTISSGTVYIGGKRMPIASTTKTFTASKDTYVDAYVISGANSATLSFTELASGATGSTPANSGIHVGKVLSNASAIVTISQSFTDTLGNPLKPISPVSTVGLYNPYKFYAYAGSAYNWGTNAWAKVALNTKLFDTNGNFDITNYRYTAPVSGFYFFTGMARTSGAVGGNLYGIQLWVNGAIGSGLSGIQAIQGSGTSGFGAPVSGLLQLNAGNYVEIAAYGTGNAGATGRYETYLMGHLVSQT